MVRSLWTAATGMIAQQVNIDTIANNLANVNTTGYKTEVNEFKSLLYQNLQRKTTTADGRPKPTSAQVGLGVRNASITALYNKQGPLLSSEKDTNFAIDGKGFFAVQGADGNTYYTRNGNFDWALGDNGSHMLTTSDGLPVLDTQGRPITLNSNYVVSSITVMSDGSICYPDERNVPQPLGIQIGLTQFNNPAGLERLDGTMYAESAASGQPINEFTSNAVEKSKVLQNYLEGSGVKVVDEMVNMIVAQRAYEMNSKAITASDEMMQQANNLRR